MKFSDLSLVHRIKQVSSWISALALNADQGVKHVCKFFREVLTCQPKFDLSSQFFDRIHRRYR